jgi:DNA-binding NarL/FixJ family response regulator
MTRVLLVDDHAVFREGLRFSLSREPDIEVVGEAGDGAQAIEALPACRPDVVVMDLAMPVLDGLAATPAVVASGAGVLVLTLSEEDANVLAALRAGASGYLVKGVAPAQVVSAVRAVASGNAVFGPHLAARMLGLFGPPDTEDPTRPALSQREHEVLELIADGLTNAQIAERLFISPVTARNHVSNILTKLQVTNRTQAARHLRGR